MPLSQIDPERYREQLAQKTARVQRHFDALGAPPAEISPSPPLHYRMRAEFRIWHEGDDVYYAMFDPDDPRQPIRIEDFPVACEAISQLMTPLLERVRAEDALKRKLFQVEFLSTSTGEMLVTLVYHRKLDERWEARARTLADDLKIDLIGRSKKQKRVLTRDYVEEVLEVEGRRYRYRQYEGGFTQPNAAVNRQMLHWACARAGECAGDLLELYCGNGNFTAPLAAHFPRVLATEVSKTSVRAARENFALNGIDNVSVVRMSAEEIGAALRGERAFRRLRDIDLDGLDLKTLFVDPPRAGLDDTTRALAARFDHILYISCNPETLERDVRALADSHRIARFALFDQFPYTEHMECGVLLHKR